MDYHAARGQLLMHRPPVSHCIFCVSDTLLVAVAKMLSLARSALRSGYCCM